MRSPISVKEVQQLTGRMTALSRFVSAEGDRGPISSFEKEQHIRMDKGVQRNRFSN